MDSAMLTERDLEAGQNIALRELKYIPFVFLFQPMNS
jgi:hypothetical protein